MGVRKYCPYSCRDLIIKRKYPGGPPVGFQCGFYKIPNPRVPENKKYKHWNTMDPSRVPLDLQMEKENEKALRCDKCLKAEEK